MKIGVVGKFGLGGFEMRGRQVAERMGWDCVEVERFNAISVGKLPRYNVLILVKYHYGHGESIRRACDRLIFDPLDSWGSEPNADPADFWRRKYNELKFDDVLATSPACMDSIFGAIQSAARIHVLPHHADPMVKPNWHNPAGPVVYAGGLQYIKARLPEIQAACTKIGRRLVVNWSRRPTESLRGVALQLHPRFPPTNTLLNKFCKPQVKLANSVAGGIPILATADPCFTSLCPNGFTIRDGYSWVSLISNALERKPPDIEPKFPSLANHCKHMQRLVVGKED